MKLKEIRFDCAVYLIHAMVFLLGVWGILTIITGQMDHSAPLYFAERQFGYMLVGLAVLEITRRISFDIYRRYAVWLNLAALIFLFLLPFAGWQVNGMRGWYRLGVFTCQPSEISKGIFLLGGALLLAKKQGDNRRFGIALAWGLIWCIPLLLQPDFGTACVYAAGIFFLYFLSGGSWKKLAVLGTGAVAGGVWFILCHPYTWKRFIGFYSDADPLGAGWHVQQLKLAIARGGWFGTKMDGAFWSNAYLPLAYNDSAFATILETLGFAGAVPVLVCGGVLIYTLGALALQKNLRRENRLLIVGCMLMIAFQALLHLSVNVCLIPPTGLPLPLVSYGGSSFLGCCLMLGLALSAARPREINL